MLPATREEIESRVLRLAMLLEVKWTIFDKAGRPRPRPGHKYVDSTNAPMPGIPIRKPETE